MWNDGVGGHPWRLGRAKLQIHKYVVLVFATDQASSAASRYNELGTQDSEELGPQDSKVIRPLHGFAQKTRKSTKL